MRAIDPSRGCACKYKSLNMLPARMSDRESRRAMADVRIREKCGSKLFAAILQKPDSGCAIEGIIVRLAVMIFNFVVQCRLFSEYIRVLRVD